MLRNVAASGTKRAATSSEGQSTHVALCQECLCCIQPHRDGCCLCAEQLHNIVGIVGQRVKSNCFAVLVQRHMHHTPRCSGHGAGRLAPRRGVLPLHELGSQLADMAVADDMDAALHVEEGKADWCCSAAVVDGTVDT